MAIAEKADMAKAVLAINPTANFSYNSEDYSTMEWRNGTTPISKEDIDAKIIELDAQYQAEADAKEANKASAKAKLIAGEALTEAEADTIVL